MNPSEKKRRTQLKSHVSGVVLIIYPTQWVNPIRSKCDSNGYESKINGLNMNLIFLTRIGSGRVRIKIYINYILIKIIYKLIFNYFTQVGQVGSTRNSVKLSMDQDILIRI
jgi:hypothetical protein